MTPEELKAKLSEHPIVRDHPLKWLLLAEAVAELCRRALLDTEEEPQ